MTVIVTAKAKETPVKKDRKKLKRYWSLIYDEEMAEKMTAK